ncbi:GNAT family N-acetyltransferase [candidate division KSB1 bacterium]|nr:GNAT family N-acetyltransferase [candidate division KSB1 bacterium]
MQHDVQFTLNAAIAPEALRDLFAQTAWAKLRPLSGITQILQQTPLHTSAWHNRKLVGFARVLTDGVYRAVLEDVIVAEAYRSRGIGCRLVELLLAELGDVEEVMLGCMENLVPYYERFGFKRVAHPIMKRHQNLKP